MNEHELQEIEKQIQQGNPDSRVREAVRKLIAAVREKTSTASGATGAGATSTAPGATGTGASRSTPPADDDNSKD